MSRISSADRPARRGVRALFLAAALVLTGVLADAPDALAVGQISYGGCVSRDGSGGLCAAPTTSAALESPTSVAISPDGASVYTTAYDGHAVARFDRAPAGQLTFADCASDDGSGGLCADVPGDVMRGPNSITVSPDGRSVYVVTLQSDSVVVFARAADGALTYAGCVSDDGSAGFCADVPGPLEGPVEALVSPDGGSVYVTTGSGVTHFVRGAGGALVYSSCVSSGSIGACSRAPGTSLIGAEGLGITADGGSVYVAGRIGDAVTVFGRGPAGRLVYAGCVSDDGSGGFCADVPGTPLTGATAVAIAPDGRSVYATSPGRGTVVAFDRAGGGQIAYAGCVSSDGSGGLCADAPGTPLDNAHGLAPSGDGESLYVTGAGGTLSVLDRDPAGRLAFAGCVSDDGSAGTCADVPGTPLTNAIDIAVSPDEGSVYSIATTSRALTHFFRKTRPETEIAAGPGPGETVAAATATFAFAADQAGARFECALDGAAFRACPTPFTTPPLADGPHALAVRALTDGDADLTPATRSFAIAAPRGGGEGGGTGDVVVAGDVGGGRRQTGGPRVRIARGPRARVRTGGRRARVRFAFAADQPGASFACSLDGRPFAPCAAEMTLSLKRGPHRLAVRAVDTDGDAGEIAVRSFRIVARRSTPGHRPK